MLRTELHCHNSFSNFHVGDDEPPYDCDISIRDQLERAHGLGIDAIFVTNHNTLDGYQQMVQYRNNHAKFKDISVFPAEEITIDTGAHILAYGIHSTIKSGTTLEETIDSISDQGGVSSAPHPFSLIDALRDQAKHCDMVEVFNSNNVDILSNARAVQFALDHNMTQVSGSDSHVLSTLGRCINLIDSENNLDDVLYSMKHGNVEISQTGYTLQSEMMDHIRYKVQNSKSYITEYVEDNYPNLRWLFALLLRVYDSHNNNPAWGILYDLALYFMKRLSKKINMEDMDPNFMRDRNIFTMFRRAL